MIETVEGVKGANSNKALHLLPEKLRVGITKSQVKIINIFMSKRLKKCSISIIVASSVNRD